MAFFYSMLFYLQVLTYHFNIFQFNVVLNWVTFSNIYHLEVYFLDRTL